MTNTTKIPMVESKTPCKDCGLMVHERTIEGCWTDKYTREHVGLCCDCYDVTCWGMPESRRIRPRPLPLEPTS